MKLSQNAQDLRDKCKDEYLACLHAPEDLREKLISVFLYHQELYSIPQTVSETMVGKIKIQWWRDVINELIEGKPCRPHPILLALQDEKEILKPMLSILDVYDNLLEESKAKTIKEVENYISNSFAVVFKIAATLLGKKNDANLAKSYGYQFLANKILRNKNFANKFATSPDELIAQFTKKSSDLLPNQKTAFSIIISENIKNLEKNIITEKGKWKTIFKMMFKKLEVL